MDEKENQEYDIFRINFVLKTHKTNFITLEALAEFIQYRLEPMRNHEKHRTLIVQELKVRKGHKTNENDFSNET